MDTFQNPHSYNDPSVDGSLKTPSTVGGQIRWDYFYRRAMVDAAKETYFGQMADVRSMPKHMGKTIKQYHYLPLLDDRNINDQGIDAQGVAKVVGGYTSGETIVKSVFKLTAPDTEGGMDYYFEGIAKLSEPDPTTGVVTGPATAAAAKGISDKAAQVKADAFAVATMGVADAAALTGATPPWVLVKVTDTGADATVNYGNLYGSSKDVGTIAAKLPTLGEHGGRVNRVGMKRIMIEGTFEKFGFFEEYTQDSMDFDTDADLLQHITGEAVKAANEMNEDQLQIDLLNSAGVVRYTGTAHSTAALDGGTDSGTPVRALDAVKYPDLVKLSIELDNNRTPKNTRVITGSRMIDTRVVNAARYMYIGSELLPTLMRMEDYFGERAYLPVAQYAAAGTIARGEQGTVGDFRMIVVPEMMHWDGAGKAATGTSVSHTGPAPDGAEHYNVYPMLVIGDASFTTIGFQTNGKTVKFIITHKKPGRETADRHDPYGETGFWSIKWWYGFMPLRPERIALIKTVAQL